jgi:hypothetical protein
MFELNESNESNEFNYLFIDKELAFESFSAFIFEDNLSPNNSYRIFEMNEKEEVINENKEFNNHKFSLNLIKNKRGRKSYKISEIKVIKKHDKFTIDNILRKFQVHYLNFIVSFINTILNNLGFKIKLFQLNYRLKANIGKKNIKYLKNSTLIEILSKEISPKYRRVNKNENCIIIDKIIKCPIVNKILSEKYMYLFDIYLKSQRIINLDKYGLDQTIELPTNIAMFDDLLKKNLKEKEYSKRLKECIDKYFY